MSACNYNRAIDSALTGDESFAQANALRNREMHVRERYPMVENERI